LGLLWQAAVKQAEAGALAAREQADDDIARADKERDEALANVAALESELAVLREVVAERDRLLQEVRELRAEALPLKLYYNQSIFMVNPKNSGRDDEFTQSGIEIIGGEKTAADYEALSLAAQALFACDEDFRLEIGESGIFRTVVDDLDLPEEQAELIHSLIESKNYPALNEALSGVTGNAAEACRALPSLFGESEVFDAAGKYMYSPELKEKLNYLHGIYEALCSMGYSGKIRVDLGLAHKKNYYTGILFRGYVEGYGQPVLSGGRYDTLLGDFGRNAAAVGFAVNVEAAAKVYLKRLEAPLMKPADVLVYSERGCEISGLNHCRELIASGLTVFNSLCGTFDEAAAYAKDHGIHRIDVVGINSEVTVKEV
ncbi:MAG: ATP phosphoribosyltransferase regulatory subunit, partial [Oscillospiraceae bacterium]